jgi:MFS family permease
MGFIGPILGPIIGSFVAENEAYGWRWCYWVTAIWNAVAFLLIATCMPETLGQALLKYKAIAWRRAARAERADGGGTAVQDTSIQNEDADGQIKEKKPHAGSHKIWRAKVEDESFGVALARNLKRPFQMLVREPILILFSIYLTGESIPMSRLCLRSPRLATSRLTNLQWSTRSYTVYSKHIQSYSRNATYPQLRSA